MVLLDSIVLELVKEKSDSLFSVWFSGRSHYCGKIDGRVFRVVTDTVSIELYENLFKDDKYMEQLFSAGLVRTELLGRSTEGFLVLEHELFNSQTMFHEWTSKQKIALVKMVINIQKLLSEKNCYLSDPHVFNVTFNGTNPLYYDFGSILPGPYPTAEWIRNLWLAQTAIESWFWALGLGYAELQDLLSLPRLSTLDAQLEALEKKEAPQKVSEWTLYDKGGVQINGVEQTYAAKHIAVMHLLGELLPVPSTAIDFGCNTGSFSRLLLKSGVGRVVAVDVDEPSINLLWQEAKKEGLPITTALCDFVGLFGWSAVHFSAELNNKVSYKQYSRLKSDLALAVALIHHLCYFRNVSFDFVARIMGEFAEKYLIIEWIPPNDRHLNGSITKNGDDRTYYTEEEFCKAFKVVFPGATSQFESTDGVRKMYLFRKT